MYDTYTFLSQKTGYDLEDAMMEMLKEYSTVIRATKEQDTQEGTDMFVDGLRMDFTLHYNGKNYTQNVGSWEGFDIGIRTANGHARFATPVIVVGIDVDPYYAQRYVIPRVKSMIGDVKAFLNYISDLYWGWYDEHPEYE